MALIFSWARYVAEQNPATGILLAKGLKAYRKNNWFVICVVIKIPVFQYFNFI